MWSFLFNQLSLRYTLASNLLPPEPPGAPEAGEATADPSNASGAGEPTADPPGAPRAGEPTADKSEAEASEENTDDVPRLMTCLELLGTDLKLQDPCRSFTYNSFTFRQSNIAMADAITAIFGCSHIDAITQYVG